MTHKSTYYTILIAGLFSALTFTSCKENSHSSASESITAKEETKEQPPQRVRLLFAGDAMCHTPQIRSARCEDNSLDFRPLFAGVKSYFDKADIAVVNLETTISANSQYSGFPLFASPAEYADALAWLGTDVALLANNHCCDKGGKGMHTTIAKLDSLDIAHTGAFLNEEDYQRNIILRFERNNIRISLFNYSYYTNGNPIPKGCKVNLIDTVHMAKVIESASADSDCIIACMHWGNEYQRQPSQEQHTLAQFLHRNGVDIIVGSHPHVVQPYTATEREITLYSLGNFISNQKDRYTDGSILAEIEVEKGRDGICRYSLRTIPVWVKRPGHRLVSSEFAHREEMTTTQRTLYERFINDTERLLERGVKF